MHDPLAPLAEFDEHADSIPAHRRCGLCWGRRRGVGVVYATRGAKRYVKCSRQLGCAGGGCGATWTAVVIETEPLDPVEMKVVGPPRRAIQRRPGPQLGER